MPNSRNADIAAIVENQITNLAASVQLNKNVVRTVVEVVAEYLDANGPLPKDPDASFQRFAELWPKIRADSRLRNLDLGPPPPLPVGGMVVAVAPLAAAIGGVIIVAEVAVAAYLIYKAVESLDPPVSHG